MLSGDDLLNFLDAYFASHLYAGDQAGIYRASPRHVRRIGLALDATPELVLRIRAEHLDCLFLHRPWKADEAGLPRDIGIISYHLAFDERLTLGFNSRLADVLNMTNVETLGAKDGRALGMIGDVPACSFAAFRRTLAEMFAGEDAEREPRSGETITRAGIVGAMTDALVREAHARGAEVYVTGQLRQPARAAIEETGLGVVAVGHKRSEQWGLRALAGILRERWANLDAVVFD